MKRVVPVMMCLLLFCLSLLANTVDKNTVLRSSTIDQNVLSDYILLKNGDRLAGTIMNDKFTLITFYSEIEIPREYIAEVNLEKEKALVDMEDNGHLSGFVTKEEVLLKLSNRTEVTLRIEDIRKIVFKATNETPQGNWQTVYIQNGDYFKGKVTSEDLQIRTTYGRVPINLEMMKRIDFYNIDGIATVELLDGGVVHGIVEPDEIDIVLSFGPTIQVYKNRIAKIENPDKEATETIQVIEAGCTLEIVAGNELAKEAFILVDGKKAGTLNSGSLTISGLGVGSHIITMDGESIDTQEIEVVFAEKLESKEINVQAKHATRAVRIKTEPTGARIWIDGRELSSTSPWQEILEVGKKYHIEVVKENHGKSELTLDLKAKGEMILLEIDIPEATTEKPQLKYPENDTKDIAAGAVTLIWESDERVASYTVEFDGKTYETKRNYLSVDAEESGKTYSWKVTAINEFGKENTSDEYSFTTQENRAPNVPNTPSPNNYSTNQPLTVTLSWECSDPEGDAITYDVYFDTNTNPTTKISTSQSGKTLSKGNLSAGTTYYWKVVAKDSKGATAEGPVWRFTTQSVPTASSYTPSSIVPQMVLVEKGSFMMGDTWGGGSDAEKPTHKVTFTYNFYIGKYEVTFSEYDAFCEATGRSKPSDSGWGRGSRPVINVSWWDAIAYCNWLSEKEKLPKAYDKDGNFLDKDGRVTTDPSKVVGYRLPTEAEWEYAARGGKKSRGYKYSGSDNVGDVTWYYSNSGGKTQEVGKKAPNELGIYDMSGNVWEWCSDWYGNYSSSAQTNPYYSTAGSARVYRGGSWGNDATGVRVAFRGYASPTFTYSDLGFRICRTVP